MSLWILKPKMFDTFTSASIVDTAACPTSKGIEGAGPGFSLTYLVFGQGIVISQKLPFEAPINEVAHNPKRGKSFSKQIVC